MKTNTVISILVYAAVFTAVWNVLEFLLSLITKSGYAFRVSRDLITPVIAGIVIWYMQNGKSEFRQ